MHLLPSKQLPAHYKPRCPAVKSGSPDSYPAYPHNLPAEYRIQYLDQSGFPTRQQSWFLPLAATCSSQGYTVYTCQKCGSSYTDSYVAPQHDYGKYLCIYCDKPDPTMDPYYSLMAWIEKHQAYTNENGEYVWVYRSGNAEYKVTCNNMGSRYIVEYNGKEEFLNFCFYNDADFVDSYYHLGEIPGRAILSKETITIPSLPLFNGYPTEYGNFKYSFSNRLDDTFSVIQRELLSPLGLNLHMFGFKLL